MQSHRRAVCPGKGRYSCASSHVRCLMLKVCSGVVVCFAFFFFKLKSKSFLSKIFEAEQTPMRKGLRRVFVHTTKLLTGKNLGKKSGRKKKSTTVLLCNNSFTVFFLV